MEDPIHSPMSLKQDSRVNMRGRNPESKVYEEDIRKTRQMGKQAATRI